jgi:hypothetical protein
MRVFVYIFSLILAVTAASHVCGQSYYTTTEFGISGGASQYFGDLNENYGFKTITPAGGIFFRKRMSSYIALKVVADYTKVSYDDKYNSDPYERLRNLNFTSPVAELAVQAEFNFFKFVTGDPLYRFTPYLTGGIGVVYYNPYTTYDGNKYYLMPLGTEGQNVGMGSKYSNFTACFPIGAGVKFWIKSGINMSIEIADRLTLTDHMDDVSTVYAGINNFPPNSVAALLQDRSAGQVFGAGGKQRGNTASSDQYMMGLISISWNFTTYRCPHSGIDDDDRVRPARY